MIVVVSPQARDDLSEAYRHLAANNPEAADHFLARIAEIIGMLAAGGVEGRFVQLGDGRTFRRGQSRPIGSTTGRTRTVSRFSGCTIRPVGRSRDRETGHCVALTIRTGQCDRL